MAWGAVEDEGELSWLGGEKQEKRGRGSEGGK